MRLMETARRSHVKLKRLVLRTIRVSSTTTARGIGLPLRRAQGYKAPSPIKICWTFDGIPAFIIKCCSCILISVLYSISAYHSAFSIPPGSKQPFLPCLKMKRLL